MPNLNKTCLVCNTAYKYCYGCPADIKNPSWMMLFDKQECREIFNTLTAETQNLITKEEAKEKLKKYDLDNMFIKKNLKDHIDKILNNTNEKEHDNGKVSANVTEITVLDGTTMESNSFDETIKNNISNYLNEPIIDETVEERSEKKEAVKIKYSSKKNNK